MPELKILFAEPPPARRIGGIDTALEGWARALGTAGAMITRHDRTTLPGDLRDFDVVHFHGLWEPAHHRLRERCRRAGIPFVVSPHGMLEPWAMAHKSWKKSLYFKFREQPSLARAAALLATSEEEAGPLRSYFPHPPITVLPLGIDPTPPPDYVGARRDLGWKEDDRVVVFLSRLHPKKGLHLLIDAWPEIQSRCTEPVRLVIVGDGERDYVDSLQSRAAPSVDWIGPQWGDAKWPYLQGADLFCLPSYSENFGFAPLEATAVGTPVITTPGTPWGSLRGGLPIGIVEPQVSALAAAVCDRLSAPRPDARARSDAHAEAMGRFGWPSLVSRYAEFYRSLPVSK